MVVIGRYLASANHYSSAITGVFTAWQTLTAVVRITAELITMAAIAT